MVSSLCIDSQTSSERLNVSVRPFLTSSGERAVLWILRLAKMTRKRRGNEAAGSLLSGRTADERLVRFRLEDCQYMVEEVRTSGTARRMLAKFVRMTAISTSRAAKR